MKTDDVLNSAFNDDHFAVWILPGSAALLPFVAVLGTYIDLASAWTDHDLVLSIAFLLTASAVGVILDSIGGWVESRIYDGDLENADDKHLSRWYRYLMAKLPSDIVAQRFIRHRVRMMKFEINMGLAVVSAHLCFWWLCLRGSGFLLHDFWLISPLMIGLQSYLLWDGFRIAELLTDLRKQMLEAYDTEPAPASPAAPPLKANLNA
jgi:hypothetical protein